MNLQVHADFQVVDESDDWIVVDKPAPLIVHPANRQPEPTLLGGLQCLLAYEIQNGARLGIITRLDRETSGVVLIAKHTEAARQLGRIFEQRLAIKEYLAVVSGWPRQDSWECTQPILRAGEIGPSEIWVRQVVNPLGRCCRTRFRVERRLERDASKFSTIRCFPETGRMHQIRVHLAYSGFPIVGDKIYSGTGAEYLRWMVAGWSRELEKTLLLPRHALHATSLEIPWAGRSCRWESPLPCDLLRFTQGQEVRSLPGLMVWNRATA